jgi:hypothetical protein
MSHRDGRVNPDNLVDGVLLRNQNCTTFHTERMFHDQILVLDEKVSILFQLECILKVAGCIPLPRHPAR